jgi:hypothetical protein
VDVSKVEDAKQSIAKLKDDTDELEKLVREFGAAAYQYSPKGRVQRKSHERNRPDLPSDAPANRSRRQVALALPPDLLQEMKSRCRELGVNRTAFIEYAIRQILKPK